MVTFNNINGVQDVNSIEIKKGEYNPLSLHNQDAKEMVDSAVSLEISRRGFAMAEKLQEFDDTYETCMSLISGIGSHEMIDGSFVDILAQNYRDEFSKLKENYAGDEYDKQLAHLNKAYDEAAGNLSVGYMKQLRLLTGDIVLKPSSGKSYLSAEEAEKAIAVEEKKAENKEYIIHPDLAEQISVDLKSMLLQKKDGTDYYPKFLSYSDIKSIGIHFLNKNTQFDISQFSDFAQSLILKYNSINGLGK